MSKPTIYAYCTALRPGCYGGPDQPIISRHETLAAARAKARRNNRLGVYALSIDGWIVGEDLLTYDHPYGTAWIGDGRPQRATLRMEIRHGSRSAR
jgi:hypothetical protein